MSALSYSRSKEVIGSWQGSDKDLKFEPKEVLETLRDLSNDCFLIDSQDQIAVASGGSFLMGTDNEKGHQVVAFSQASSPSDFGDPAFIAKHGLKSAYMAGSMANAISSIELVTAMGKAGYLASYGSGGVGPEKLLDAIITIKNALPSGPYAFNLIHSPNEPIMEQKAVDL